MTVEDTHAVLFLLLGLSRVIGSSSGVTFNLFGVAIGFGLADLTGYSLATSTTRSPLVESLLLLLLVLLVSRLSDLDDDLTTVELLLVQEVDSLLRGFSAVQRDESIASRTASTKDDGRGEAGEKKEGDT